MTLTVTVPATVRVTGVRLLAALRRHWLVASLVALGAVLRILVMVAYAPAFWFFGDSGEYIALADLTRLHRYRPLGYPVLLDVLRPTGDLAVVAAVQHLAGLALAVAVYALLVHRGLPRVVASLAVVPVLLDALQVDLEHYILGETLFTALLTAAVLALLWREHPGPVACAAAGLLLAAAWFTRPIALGIAVLLAAYLGLRRIGIRQFAAYALAFALPWGAVVWRASGQPSPYGSGASGFFLYGRTATVADCDRLELRAELRPLCPDHGPDAFNEGRADWYIWVSLPPEYREDPQQDPLLREFAVEVITQQPGDYLAVVAKESAPYFLPGQHLGHGHDVISQVWTMPASVRDSPAYPYLASPGFAAGPADPAHGPPGTALTRALHWYSVHVRVPGLFATATLLATLVALAFAVRRRRVAGLWRDARDAGWLVAVALALLVTQVAISMYEPRYGAPTLPLFSIAAALAWQALRRARRPATTDAGAADESTPQAVGASSSSDWR